MEHGIQGEIYYHGTKIFGDVPKSYVSHIKPNFSKSEVLIIRGSRRTAKLTRELRIIIFPSYKVKYAFLRNAMPYFWIRACLFL